MEGLSVQGLTVIVTSLRKSVMLSGNNNSQYVAPKIEQSIRVEEVPELLDLETVLKCDLRIFSYHVSSEACQMSKGGQLFPFKSE